MSHRFPKSVRLRKRRDYLHVQGTGSKIHGKLFLAVVAPRQTSDEGEVAGRVGVTVSKRVGNAVTRNRIKRLVREYVRKSERLPPPGVDVVVIAKRPAARAMSYAEVAADLGRIEGRLAT